MKKYLLAATLCATSFIANAEAFIGGLAGFAYSNEIFTMSFAPCIGYEFNDKFAIGYRAYISPKKDNYKNDLLTESRFYVILGPQDLKVALSYDFVRELAHVDFMFLVGTKSSKITFDKLTTKDFDGGSQKRDFYKNNKPIKIDNPENI